MSPSRITESAVEQAVLPGWCLSAVIPRQAERGSRMAEGFTGSSIADQLRIALYHREF